MLTVARKRLLRDLKKLEATTAAQCAQSGKGGTGIAAAPVAGDIMNWTAIIFGPDDTAWEGGAFKLAVTFSEDFPTKPPHIRFITRVFHPNVYANGEICLDILSSQWSPIYDIAAILTSIQSLLCDPNPNSPANSEAAQLWSENRREYNRKVMATVEESIANCSDSESGDGDEVMEPTEG